MFLSFLDGGWVWIFVEYAQKTDFFTKNADILVKIDNRMPNKARLSVFCVLKMPRKNAKTLHFIFIRTRVKDKQKGEICFDRQMLTNCKLLTCFIDIMALLCYNSYRNLLERDICAYFWV